jgi:hypothetical protein
MVQGGPGDILLWHVGLAFAGPVHAQHEIHDKHDIHAKHCSAGKAEEPSVAAHKTQLCKSSGGGPSSSTAASKRPGPTTLGSNKGGECSLGGKSGAAGPSADTKSGSVDSSAMAVEHLNEDASVTCSGSVSAGEPSVTKGLEKSANAGRLQPSMQSNEEGSPGGSDSASATVSKEEAGLSQEESPGSSNGQDTAMSQAGSSVGQDLRTGLSQAVSVGSSKEEVGSSSGGLMSQPRSACNFGAGGMKLNPDAPAFTPRGVLSAAASEFKPARSSSDVIAPAAAAQAETAPTMSWAAIAAKPAAASGQSSSLRGGGSISWAEDGDAEESRGGKEEPSWVRKQRVGEGTRKNGRRSGNDRAPVATSNAAAGAKAQIDALHIAGPAKAEADAVSDGPLATGAFEAGDTEGEVGGGARATELQSAEGDEEVFEHVELELAGAGIETGSPETADEQLAESQLVSLAKRLSSNLGAQPAVAATVYDSHRCFTCWSDGFSFSP